MSNSCNGNSITKDGKEYCGKCNGTGTYKWGASVNGRPSNVGTCYSCQGKGVMTKKDVKRNDYYWNYCARII
jgi:DnaJ-class molecular chaperone